MIEEIDLDVRSDEQFSDEDREILINSLKSAANSLIAEEGWEVSGYQVSVSIVGPGEIQELNRSYRGIDAPTDVLSFPLDEVDWRGVALLGDIVLNFSQAKSQAEEYGHSIQREAVYLAVHSLLHLFGYDHEDEEEKRAMRFKEEVLMSSLGLGRG